jgi:hypothetical protein
VVRLVFDDYRAKGTLPGRQAGAAQADSRVSGTTLQALLERPLSQPRVFVSDRVVDVPYAERIEMAMPNCTNVIVCEDRYAGNGASADEPSKPGVMLEPD